MCWIVFGLALILVQFVQAQEVLYLFHYNFKGDTDYEDIVFLGQYLHKYSSDGWVHAPVHLPQGAIIQGIHLICWDRAAGDIECRFCRMATWNGTYESIFAVFSSGSADFIRRLATWIPLVAGGGTVTKAYSYVVRVYFPDSGSNNFRLYGVKAQYINPGS